VLLGSAIAGYFFVSHRHQVGQMARHAALWGLIFIGAIAGFGLWQDIRDDVVPRQSVVSQEGRIEVPRAFDGHYYLVLQVNGTPVQFVVDTGATDVVLSQQDAARAGIALHDLAYTGRANTANGMVRTAHVRLDSLELGPIADRGVLVAVNEGEMDGSLLGMSYLDRFDSLEITGGKLILTR